MEQLRPVLAQWRGILAFCFMVYVYSRTVGSFNWLLGAAAGAVVYRALQRFFPVRTAPPVDEATHGSASFASRRDIGASGHLAPAIATDRYVLGITLEPASPPTRIGTLLRRQAVPEPCLPVVTTRTKFAGSGERIDDGHLVTVASAGSGKGIAVVQPNLRCYEGPVVALDPKGENFLRTHQARARLGHRICLIDPFATIPATQAAPYLARLNPLDALQAFYDGGDHAAVLDEAAALAEMMIVKEGSERDPHWNDKAGAFLKAAILFVVYGKGYQDRQKTPLALSTVKDAVYEYFASDDGVQKFIKRCQESPYLQAMAGQAAMIAPTERSSVLSTLLRHTDFLDSPNVRRSLGATDFTLADLKTQKLSVYLVLPANNLKAYNRLARLWVGSLLRAMMRDSLTTPRWRVLFLLDEVAQLGQMEPLEQAMTLGRGYGIDAWLIFQDIHQMKDAYGDRWESLLANARVQQYFGVQDVATAEYVSKKLGQSTIRTVSQSHTTGANSGTNWGSSSAPTGDSASSGGSKGRSTTAGSSVQQTGRALLQPDEVVRLPEDQLLIFVVSHYPILARKCSVLDPAVTEALEAVCAIDAPAPLEVTREGRAMGAGMSPAYAQPQLPQRTGAAGAAQMSQAYVHAAEHEHDRGRGL